MNRAALLGLVFGLLATGNATALEMRNYDCTVTEFTDDSRYPPDAETIQRARDIAILIIDAGDRVLVETTAPGSETESHQLPVTERTADGLVAANPGEFANSLTLQARPEAPAMGQLTYRSYEVDTRLSFSCAP